METQYTCIILDNQGNQESILTIQSVHPDDTVQWLKMQILRQLNMVAYEELYLFSHETANNAPIPLGKRFSVQNEPEFKVNPYEVAADESGKIFVDTQKNPILALENMLLLSHPPFENTIYVCTALSTLEFAETSGFDPYIFLKLYFPLLIIQHGIKSIDDLNQQHQTLVDATRDIVNDEYSIRIGKTIDLFYDVYNNKTEDFKYAQNGIKEFNILLTQPIKLSLPLEIMFKNIHATIEMPLIKYNPGFRRENIYRLYSEDITKYGEKVPHLERNVILRLAKSMGRKKTLSFYLEGKRIRYKGINDVDMFIELDHIGNIRIQGQTKTPIDIETLNTQITNRTNSLLDMLNKILAKSGHKLEEFTNIKDLHRVRVISLMNIWAMRIKREIPLKKLARCLNPIFEFYGQDNLEKGVDARFKRVENYQAMEAEDIFIYELYSKTEDLQYVFESFMESFPDKSEEYARNKIADFFNNLRELKVKNSPGFPVRMSIQVFNDIVFNLEANISDSIEYLDVMNVYVDSLLRITQFPSTTTVSDEAMQNLCLKPTEKAVDAPMQAIVALAGIHAVEEIPIDVQPIQFDSASSDSFFGKSSEASVEIEDEKQEPEDDIELEFEEEYEGGAPHSKTNPFEELEDEMVLEHDELPTDAKYEENGYSFAIGGSAPTLGGGEKEGLELEEYKKKLDGMPLHKGRDNIFLSRLKERDPALFLDKDVTTSKGKFDAYAKVCQANFGQQPVILSQEEKEEVDKKHPGSYKNALEYGSKANKNWYICPRYWCLLTNSPLTDEEVKSGKCGGIIPKGEKTVPKGKYVIEIKSDKLHMENGEYVEATPGFLKDGKHPDGLCLPCCFKKGWDAPQQKKRREACQKKSEEDEADEQSEFEEKEEAEEKEAEEQVRESESVATRSAQATPQAIARTAPKIGYVVGMDKYPVGKGRWGFLPIGVQHMLQIDQSKISDVNNAGMLKANVSTLLRCGIEDSETQTFVSCLANVYNQNTTLEEMRKILSDAVTLDIFIKLQNGSLPTEFQPKSYAVEDIDFRKYENTQFIQNINMNSLESEDFVADTIAAFENFQDFLQNPDSMINHEYLWDLVTMPNNKLFPTGLNLAILSILENDITDNIQVICPTSAYSNYLYDSKKPTLILILREGKFEPVYMYENAKPPRITKTFTEKDGPKSLQYILQIIRSASKNYCAPLPSMPKVYRFERNKSAIEIMSELKKINEPIKSQILNYQNKTIGFMTERVYIPVAPSAIIDDIPVQYMDDDSLKLPYYDTKDALNDISLKSDSKILCRPTHKIIEDAQIVGILTETNQFIAINPPIENTIMDELEEVNEANYLLADKAMASNTIDTLRDDSVRKIKLETHFYKAFRSTFRLIVNQPEYAELKKKLIEAMQGKQKRFMKLLHKILDSYIDFQVYDESILSALDEISTCIGSTEEKPYCLLQTSSHKLILPKYHLLSGYENANVYFVRLSDEIRRNKRIQTYLFDSTVFDIGFSNEYSVDETEMIVLQSLMTAEYFASIGLPAAKIFRGKIPYEQALPYKTAPYMNRISLEQQSRMYSEPEIEKDELLDECTREIGDIVGNNLNIWRKTFPKNTKEMFLEDKPQCTFYPLMIVYRGVYRKDIKVDELKKTLYNAYRGLADITPILKLWRLQGKRDISDMVRNGKATLQEAIMSSGFYLSNIDIWALAREYMLPIILFTSMKKIKHLLDDVSWVRLGKNDGIGRYWFIRAPTEPDGTSNTVFGYSMINESFELEGLNQFKAKYDAAVEENSKNVVDFSDFLELL